MKIRIILLFTALLALAVIAGAQVPDRVVMGGKAVTMVADVVYAFPSARPRVVAVGGTDQGLGVFLETVSPGFSALPPFDRQAGVEVYASYKPDLVILKSSLKKSLGAGLDALGIKTAYLDLETPDDYYRDLATVGRIFGDPARATVLIDYYRGVVAAAGSRFLRRDGEVRRGETACPARRRRSGDGFEVPPDSWIQTLLVEMAGGQAVWKGANPGSGWAKVGPEQIAAWNPDVFVVVSYKERASDDRRPHRRRSPLFGAQGGQVRPAGRLRPGLPVMGPAGYPLGPGPSVACRRHQSRFHAWLHGRGRGQAFLRPLLWIRRIRLRLKGHASPERDGEVTLAGRDAQARAAPVSMALALLTLLAVSCAALLFGRYPTPGFIDPRILFDDPMALRVIMLVRLPRTLGALLLGAALGASGAAMQFVFANPLVDAGFLGVSQGASFGAALSMILGGGSLALFGSAFGFALLALGMSVAIAGRIRFGGAVLRLILSGMAVSAFFSALVALLKYGADPLSTLPEITYWLMGGLSGTSWKNLAVAAPLALVSVGLLVALRWRTALLSLDEATAASLGARPRLERALVLVTAAAGVAAVTAMAGVVAWVGLIVPHLARLVLGGDGSSTVPGSAVLGATFVVGCDAVSRGLFPGELPLGVTTSLIGTAVFFFLLIRRRVNVERG